MDLPKLFKYDSKGKLRVWYVTVQDDLITTFSGQVDGELTPHQRRIKPVNVGKKNYKSAEEKALEKAKKAWEDKVREGMRIRKEVERFIFPISPVLAKKYDEVQEKQPHYLAQYKFDGFRGIASNVDGQVVIHSRGRKVIPFLFHIKEEVNKLFSILPPELRSVLHFDGELYLHGSSRQKVESLLAFNAKEPNVKQHLVQYHIYDLVDDESSTYEVRYELLQTLFEQCQLKSVFLVECKRIEHDEGEIKKLHQQAVECGYEGLILRDPNAIYRRCIKHRSDGLLKYKEFFDDEAPVVDAYEGEGTREGCIIWILEKDGKQFSATIKANVEEQREYWQKWNQNRKQYLGKLMQYKYYSLSDDGIPLHATALGFRSKDDL